MNELVRRWQALAEAGLTVSICYGRSKDRLIFSVDVMSRIGEIFSKPFAAETLEQAIEIAEKESYQRGWISRNDLRQ